MILGILLVVVGGSNNVPFGTEVATTYLFGESEEIASLSSSRSSGFVELSFDGRSLTIDAVRRPSYLPSGAGFCTYILPAAVSHFVEHILGFPDLSPVSSMVVTNVGDPVNVACRCYTRLMVEFGFEIVNKEQVESVSKFCTRNSIMGLLMTGHRLDNESSDRSIPVALDTAAQIIEASRITTRIRPIGFYSE